MRNQKYTTIFRYSTLISLIDVKWNRTDFLLCLFASLVSCSSNRTVNAMTTVHWATDDDDRESFYWMWKANTNSQSATVCDTALVIAVTKSLLRMMISDIIDGALYSLAIFNFPIFNDIDLRHIILRHWLNRFVLSETTRWLHDETHGAFTQNWYFRNIFCHFSSALDSPARRWLFFCFFAFALSLTLNKHDYLQSIACVVRQRRHLNMFTSHMWRRHRDDKFISHPTIQQHEKSMFSLAVRTQNRHWCVLSFTRHTIRHLIHAHMYYVPS